MDDTGLLHASLILVAEDEAFIAFDIAMAIEDAGGVVAGPVARVKDALSLIARGGIKGAILDYNLADGDATPVIKALREAGIPTTIHTGIGLPQELVDHFPDLVIFVKPTPSDTLVRQLLTLIER